MNKRKRLVIPVLLGLLCICLFPVTGYAAESSQSMELTLEVPEKPAGTSTAGTNTAGAKTGDDTNVARIAVLAILAVLSLEVCILLLAKKKKDSIGREDR